MTALTLVSALALALVYGLGGCLALTGSLDPGDVVALALLLTRLYAPLTALASARRGDERARELRARLRGARPAADDRRARDAPATAGGRALGGARRRPLRLPGGRPGLAGVAGGRRDASTPAAGKRCCTRSRSAPSPGRWSRWSGRRARASRRSRRCCPASTTSTPERCGSAVWTSATWFRRDPRCARARHAGRAPVPRVDPREPPPRPGVTDDEIWDALRRARLGRSGRDARRRARHDGRRARLPPLRRRTPAADDRAAAAGAPTVVVLDEATAHLDSSPRRRSGSPGDALAGRTALVIAHRLSTVRAADQILVLEQGESSSAARTTSSWPRTAATRAPRTQFADVAA